MSITIGRTKYLKINQNISLVIQFKRFSMVCFFLFGN